MWTDFYVNDPMKWVGKDLSHLEDLVLGGETTMWSEKVDAISFDSVVWPRTSAAAEQLWSPTSFTNTSNLTANVSHRLAEHRCRMVRRGIRSAPLNDMDDARGLNPSCM